MKKQESSFIRIAKKKAGKPPGSLEYAVSELSESTSIRLYLYNESTYEERKVDDIGKIMPSLKPDTSNWLHITGFEDVATIENIGLMFNIDSLIMEDILNTEHLPKMEETDDYLFFTMNILHTVDGIDILEKNHISFYLTNNCLISFQQKNSGDFDQVIYRLGKSIGKSRQRGSDYLLYRLIDTIVDNYYLPFEHIEIAIDEIEEVLIRNRPAAMVGKIQHQKNQLMFLKRNIFPVNEAMRNILRTEGILIKENTIKYFRDTADHLNHLVQSIEGYRENITSLMELQMANNATRMNDVIKTLTIISTIFIPLTFLAGVYGMNFDYMPELRIIWAYPALLFVMLAIGTGMFLYMKRRKWF